MAVYKSSKQWYGNSYAAHQSHDMSETKHTDSSGNANAIMFKGKVV
jgi:hypothetical protein